MLKMQNVGKVYRTDLIETHALRDFSLDVAAGEFVAVTGPSGSGKTTFLNVAGLLETFDTGHYVLDGSDVSRLSDDARSRLRNEKIGFIFQSFNLIDDLNVAENVEVSLLYRRVGSGERRRRVAAALERVGIAHRAKHQPHQLSGGQQQRVAIARALVAEPRLILADEPTGNLDTENGTAVMSLLTEINDAGTTVVMVTHSLVHAGYARRTIKLLDGRVVSETLLAA